MVNYYHEQIATTVVMAEKINMQQEYIGQLHRRLSIGEERTSQVEMGFASLWEEFQMLSTAHQALAGNYENFVRMACAKFHGANDRMQRMYNEGVTLVTRVNQLQTALL